MSGPPLANIDFIRVEAATALAALIEAACDPGVTVDVLDPGARNLKDEHIFADGITGNLEYPSVSSSYMLHDDRFSVKLIVWVLKKGKGATPIAAAQRCQELMSFVNRGISDDPTLGGMDGIIDATIGTVDGPEFVAHEEGWGAYAEIEIQVHSRLTNY